MMMVINTRLRIKEGQVIIFFITDFAADRKKGNFEKNMDDLLFGGGPPPPRRKQKETPK